jgi:hypothetical protein
VLLTSYQCAFPGCKEFGEENHHITYSPEVTKRLCKVHHEEITILNTQRGGKLRHAVSNKDRWRIWFQWIQGKLKVRRTKKAMEYIEQGRAKLAASRVHSTERADGQRALAEAMADSALPLTARVNGGKKANAAKSRKRAVHQAKSSKSASRRKKTPKRTRKNVKAS